MRNFKPLFFTVFLLGAQSLAMSLDSFRDLPSDDWQIAIWEKQKSGDIDEGDLKILYSQMEEFLCLEEPEEVMHDTLTGVTEAKLVRFVSNIKGVFKNGKSVQSIYSETAAYKLDRLINLNIVPLTTIREINGEIGSIQLYIPKCSFFYATNSDLYYGNGADQMNLLDYILVNSDRAGRICLKRKDKDRLIAIDHGFCPNYWEGPERKAPL